MALDDRSPDPDFDVVVVGAGLSGIGAACHLRMKCPSKSLVILEGRDAIGGTWDLFRYPGIRSDSDMYTLGYSFRPWRGDKAMADGPSILNYIRETAREHDVERLIRFGHRVERIEWSSSARRWTVYVRKKDGESTTLTCRFVFACSGYYDYEEGHTPEFEGQYRFRGRIVHPQKWTPDIDYTDKRVVVIGSGATAVTLVPELAKRAAHVTMLQRSPTYVVAYPAVDGLARWLDQTLPPAAAYNLTRGKQVVLATLFYRFCQRFPAQARKLIAAGVRKHVGDDLARGPHSAPRYSPWEQRLCVAPDGDLFAALRSGRADVVTDRIATFTESGIALESGTHLAADLIVTATGLKIQLFGGAEVVIDGRPMKPGDTMMYKGTLFRDVPNLAVVIGYTNASWTLKADLSCEYVCRLLNHMDRHRQVVCTPRVVDADVGSEPLMPLSSGYVMRAQHLLPQQGSKAPWRLSQSYFGDVAALRYAKLEDGSLELR